MYNEIVHTYLSNRFDVLIIVSVLRGYDGKTRDLGLEKNKK